MSTKVIEKELTNLKQEVATLRSLVISVVAAKVNDPEGKYKPAFIKRVLKAAKEPATYEYTGKGSLLKQLQKSNN